MSADRDVAGRHAEQRQALGPQAEALRVGQLDPAHVGLVAVLLRPGVLDPFAADGRAVDAHALERAIAVRLGGPAPVPRRGARAPGSPPAPCRSAASWRRDRCRDGSLLPTTTSPVPRMSYVIVSSPPTRGRSPSTVMVAAVSSTRFTCTSVTFQPGPAVFHAKMSSAGSLRAASPSDFQAPMSLSVGARQKSGSGPRSSSFTPR